MKKVEMAHLHTHSTYSELDAIAKIPQLVKRALEFGHKAIALTDHGTIAGVPEFFRECKKQGIKPIFASEFYMVADAEQSRADKKRLAHHLVLLAMNAEGWINIKKLTTKANEKFYYVPRIDYKDLTLHSDGIICLTGCLKGIVPYNLAEKDFDEAMKNLVMLRGIFGDRLYLEVQDGGLDVQPEVNQALRLMGRKLDMKCVGTIDSHYIDKEDVEAHEGIWAIRTGHTFDTPIGYGKGRGFRPYYSTREYWLKDAHHILGEPLTTENNEQRMTSLLQHELEATLEVVDRIGDVEIEKKMHLPKYAFIPDIRFDSFQYLEKLVEDGYGMVFGHRLGDASEVYQARIAKEMADIKDAGLADYFLIVWDIVSWARSEGISVGPGRGSAAGSLVSYCLSITEIEPIKFGLIWERFYNAGRKGSLADIDMDFSKKNRGKVINYIRDRFGEDRVAQMVTFNRLMPKAVLKDVAKVLGKNGMSFEDANVMTRLVGLKAKTIEKALENSERLQEYEKKHPRLFRIAKKLQGCQKSRGKHAAGLIISDEPFENGGVPLRWDTKDKVKITEYDGETLDGMGYVKMDVLGLKTMDVLGDMEEEINGTG